MKTSTRVVAWVNIVLYIVQSLAALAIIAMLASGRSAVILGYLKSNGYNLTCVDKPAALVMICVVAISFAQFWIWLYPWLALLKRRPWAWWMLTVLAVLSVTASLHPLLDQAFTLTRALTVASATGILPMITLVTLLADRPSGWRGSQSRGKAPKRKKRARK